MSGTIILIGGGSFEKGETFAFDQYAIQQSKKEKPQVLIIPAASKDDQGYGKRLKQYFRKLGAQALTLRLWHTKYNKEEVHEAFQKADIIYLGAGSTTLLLESLNKWELNTLLIKLYQEGKIIIGISAGANVLCTYGYSDIKENQCELIQGIGIVPCVCTPHANQENRKNFLEDSKAYDIEKLSIYDRQAYVYQNETIKKL